MSLLITLKEGGSLGIDTIGNLPIDEDIDLLPDNTGTMVLLETVTLSSAGFVDFTSLEESTYRQHVVYYRDVAVANDTKHLSFRMSKDGGTTYDSTAGIYKWHREVITNNSGSSSNAFSYNNGTNYGGLLASQGNASNEFQNGRLYFSNAGDSAEKTIVVNHNIGNTSSNGLDAMWGGVLYNSVGTVNAIRFQQHDGGNVREGVFSLYGISEDV